MDQTDVGGRNCANVPYVGLAEIFGQQHDSITYHLNSHKIEALWESTIQNMLNSW